MTADSALDAAALRAGLAAPWRRLDVVAETESTNADLLRRAANGDDIAGAVLLAEHQTAGRGRAGRSWSSVPGEQIALSVAVDAATVPIDRWGWLPLAIGVAVVDAVNVGAGLKWPNDVLAGASDGKLAGILVEVAAPGPIIVVGVGLNVTLDPADVAGAVSLRSLGAPEVDRGSVVRALLERMADRIAQWQDGDPVLAADYRRRSITIGSRVRAHLAGARQIVGVARDIDADGRLVVDAGDETTAVSAGDVVHLRPGD
jgi:BirA family transcriptional regulator, biotin operon repressor / biotin---[acetyl-CoA-carboxylase] ligase